MFLMISKALKLKFIQGFKNSRIKNLDKIKKLD